MAMSAQCAAFRSLFPALTAKGKPAGYPHTGEYEACFAGGVNCVVLTRAGFHEGSPKVSDGAASARGCCTRFPKLVDAPNQMKVRGFFIQPSKTAARWFAAKC